MENKLEMKTYEKVAVSRPFFNDDLNVDLFPVFFSSRIILNFTWSSISLESWILPIATHANWKEKTGVNWLLTKEYDKNHVHDLKWSVLLTILKQVVLLGTLHFYNYHPTLELFP